MTTQTELQHIENAKVAAAALHAYAKSAFIDPQDLIHFEVSIARLLEDFDLLGIEATFTAMGVKHEDS